MQPWANSLFRAFFTDLEEMGHFVAIVIEGVHSATKAKDMAEWMIRYDDLEAEVGRHPRLTDADKELRLAPARRKAAIANKLIETDCTRLHSMTLVATWSSLEVLSENLAVGLIIHQPNVLAADAIRQVRISLADYERLAAEERALYLVKELRRNLKADLLEGVSYFEVLLDVLGVGGAVDSETRKAVFEFGHVRNVLVHRGGIADRRICDKCPRLQLAPGMPLRPDAAQSLKYCRAAGEYALQLAQRFRDLPDKDSNRTSNGITPGAA